MNRREFNRDGRFYELDRPWYAENSNVILRSFHLKEALDRVFESLEKIKEIEEQLESNESEPADIATDFQFAVHDLTRGLEEFHYCFPNLVSEEWFYSLWQASAGANWRANDGKFDNEPHRINFHIHEITDHIPTGQEPGPRRYFDIFLHSREGSIHDSQVDELFKDDVYEARDHLVVGYYSTALLVLGRTVEKALLEIGRERKITRVKKHQHRTWDEATFRDRTEALANADHPKETGKMISRKQRLEISILIDYRNNVAHTDYETIEREEAIRKCESALDLLKDLSELLGEIREIEDEEIKELTVRVEP